MHRAAVYMTDTIGIDDHRFEGFTPSGHEVHQAVFEVSQVGKIERPIHTQHEDVFPLLEFFKALNVAVISRIGHFPQYGNVWTGRTINYHDQGQYDPSANPRLNAHRQGNDKSGDQHPKIRTIFFPEMKRLFEIDQTNDRDDHHRRQYRVGQVIKQGGEEQQGQHNQDGAKNGSHARFCPRLVIDSSTRKPARDGITLEKSRPQVGRSQCNQLLIGVYLVIFMLGLYGFGYRKTFHKAHQRNSQGNG